MRSHDASDALWSKVYEKSSFINRENLPQPNASIITRCSVLSSPSESLLSQTEVLSDRQDRIWQATLQCIFVGISHVICLIPVKSLVEVDVGCSAVVDRQSSKCDVHVHQPNVNADRGWNLFAWKRFVWCNNLLLCHMPRWSQLANYKRKTTKKKSC